MSKFDIKKGMKPEITIKKEEHKMMLHYAPKVVVANLEALLEQSKKEENKVFAYILEDALTILKWACARLPMKEQTLEKDENKEK